MKILFASDIHGDLDSTYELINIFNNIYSNEDQYKYKILGIKFEIVK